jgi:hypothetical protein
MMKKVVRVKKLVKIMKETKTKMKMEGVTTEKAMRIVAMKRKVMRKVVMRKIMVTRTKSTKCHLQVLTLVKQVGLGPHHIPLL